MIASIKRLLIVGLVMGAHAAPISAQGAKFPLSGPEDADLAPFDELMIKFMTEHRVPGAALAVAKDGKLVYARGFGHADQDKMLGIQPTTRFRVASISKPITAAMILRLVELGLLKLDDNPFEFLQIELPANGDPRLKKVTIRQLLHHTAGFDRAKSFDPMFRPITIAWELDVEAPAKPIDVIRYMTSQKLDFDPGTRYAYSNFGYCVLGRVIEKATGQTYDAAVQKHLFDPISVKTMQLGQTLTPAKNETHYFDSRKAFAVIGPNRGTRVPRPYGAWYLEAMDAHGGWIANAPDLVRFATAFDHPEKCKILKAGSIKTMFTPPAGITVVPKDDGVAYACGWMVRKTGDGKINAWHTGALDGTESLLVRRHDGLCWVVLFNTRKGLVPRIDPLVHEAADKVKRWPQRDLFGS